MELGQASHVVLASTLRRSIESVQLVVPGARPVMDPVFREVQLPTRIQSGVRLRPRAWTTLARVAWYCGWSPGVENFAGARARASVAAKALASLAEEHGQVILVGHGLMNGLIGKRLLRFGWRGPLFRPRRHWAFGVYRKMVR